MARGLGIKMIMLILLKFIINIWGIKKKLLAKLAKYWG
jgi:hypothetical protein